VVRALYRVYTPILGLSIRHKAIAIVSSIALLALAGFAVRSLGLEFFAETGRRQPLDQGYAASHDLVGRGQYLRQPNAWSHFQFRGGGNPLCPSMDGRMTAPTPPGSLTQSFFVPLKPVSEWRPKLDKDDLTSEVLTKLQAEFPGVEFNFSQYLQDKRG